MKIKKIMLTVLTLIMLTTLSLTVSASEIYMLEDFSDYPYSIRNHWATEHIITLMHYGGVNGLSDGKGGYKLEPDRSITTAELLSMIIRLSENKYTDSIWPMKVMEAAVNLDLIPYSMINEGNEAVSREKMAMILINAAEHIKLEDVNGAEQYAGNIPDLYQADSEYHSAIQKAYGMGLLKGTGKGYEPKKTTSRAEMFVIINRLFEFEDRIYTGHEITYTDEYEMQNATDYLELTPYQQQRLMADFFDSKYYEFQLWSSYINGKHIEPVRNVPLSPMNNNSGYYYSDIAGYDWITIDKDYNNFQSFDGTDVATLLLRDGSVIICQYDGSYEVLGKVGS